MTHDRRGGANHVKLAGRCPAQVDYPASTIRPAINNADDHGLAVPLVCYFDPGAER
jgi:hypothetical protein